ncbi:MAG: polyphosphate kinase 2 family protein [Acidobacteria bacterium]|nr:polyphosphate kinase 2 family protein [Acidobacteriota bacterium]
MSYAHRVTGGRAIRLQDFDPDEDAGLNREQAEAKLVKLGQEIVELQELLYAAGETAVLIVLQGMDTSGKDGTIRHVMGSMNPLGCDVAAFKVPTESELAHDFLWRVHARTPGRGRITIFNRSRYEDVLVVRVHGLVPRDVWSARYDQINHFERLLADSGTLVLKFFLHISKSEQKERLLEREQETTKAWKLSVGDWQERRYWSAYMRAYEDAINNCSTSHAPWFVVPADKKWFRNLAVAETIVEALKPWKRPWRARLEEIGREERTRIEEMRKNERRKSERKGA